MPREAIRVTLKDGKVIEGTSFETTPLGIAKDISNSLAKRTCVARVSYSRRVGEVDRSIVHAEEDAEGDDAPDYSHLLSDAEIAAADAGGSETELWDLSRPLEGDCTMELLSFDDDAGRSTFWHSAAHVLGASMEEEYGCKLTMGPPTQDGFYYDAYIGETTVKEADLAVIDARAAAVAKAKQPFERLVLTKEEALELFADNPFKVQIISAKIPDGGATTAYRCGRLIDLCTGPHVPDTGRVGALQCLRTGAAFWLGDTANDALSRVTAVAFPDKKQLKKHLKALDDAKKFDHRALGTEQELFFFHELSPGSAFFLPHGTRIYQRLQDLIRRQYWKRGFDEAITPNVFNLELWRQSGHAKHYLDDMFTFSIEDAQFGLKPMNCPGHCLIFKHRVRSYRELPLRIADFGALHRNEASGALTGLTRVRRFQQDDGHIFCRTDQIEEEVQGALDFMAAIYETLGFRFELDLSTRPKKALGDPEVWKRAELMMKAALVRFDRPWKINPGDGAFYGPKIDVKVYDAFGRRHQCATIQLDFQLPLRFDLKYQKKGSTTDAKAEGKKDKGDKKAKKGKKDKPAADAAGEAADAAPEDAAAAAAGDAPAAAAGAAAPSPAAAAPAGEAAHAASASASSGSGSGSGSGCGCHPEDEDPDFDKYATPPPLGPNYERPVIVHRAVLGSVERMFAVLTEHLKGKWPMWLSPRQAMIVPVHQRFVPYCREVLGQLRSAGIYADVDDSGNTLNKKVRAAQVAQYNLILVIGEKEATTNSAAVRTRDNTDHGTIPMPRLLAAVGVMMDDQIDDWDEVCVRVDARAAAMTATSARPEAEAASAASAGDAEPEVASGAGDA